MASEEASSFNSFNNDGSFLAQFRRLQEQKKQQKSEQSSSKPPTMTASGFMPATLSSKRVTKSGAVVMKLSGVKKKTAPAVKLKRPPAALRGDSDSEDEGGDSTGMLFQSLRAYHACVCWVKKSSHQN